MQQAAQALLDRHVARQQGQRVGVAGLLDLQLGDQLEHVDHPAEAAVATLLDDDEVFLHALARAAGQQAADLLQRLADVHREEVAAHQPADRLAREQVGGEGFQQGVGQRVAVDDADRLALFVQHRQGVQVGLGAEGFEHFGDGRVLADRGLLVEQRGEIAAVLAERGRRAVEPWQEFLGVPWRLFLGAAQQVALDQVDAHLGEGRQFLDQFDALGDHLGAGGLGHLQDGVDELALDRVLVDAVDEVAVDLHVVRTQLGPEAQAGVAGAEVVQGDGEAHGAVVVQGGVEQLQVLDGGLLGEFDHHLAGRDAEFLQQPQGAPRLVAGFQQGFRRDIEEQLAVQLEVAVAAAGALACQQFQFAQAPRVAGHGEQGDGGVQRTVGGAAGQRLVA